MKQYSLLKTGLIGFLGAVICTLYLTKIKSIFLGASVPSYVLFTCVIALCGLLLYNKDDISNYIKLISKRKTNIKNVPADVYRFCRNYYFSSEDVLKQFVKGDVKNKGLANFFVRYLDKNTQSEIDDYIATQDNILDRNEKISKKIISNNNIIIIAGVCAAYIYDSNIKGVILIGAILGIINIISSKRLDENVYMEKQMHSLYRNISSDILEFRNAKYIMYKCENALMLTDDVTVESLELSSPTNTTIDDAISMHSSPSLIPSIENLDYNIERRKSMLVTINKSAIDDERKDKVVAK